MPRSPLIPLMVRPRLKVWLEIDDHYAFGYGLGQILAAVDQAGSIKQAAGDLGKSYRHVWGRIKLAEKTMGRQLVESQVGGKDRHRSCLTPAARALVDAFLALRTRMMELLDREFARRFRALLPGSAASAADTSLADTNR